MLLLTNSVDAKISISTKEIHETVKFGASKSECGKTIESFFRIYNRCNYSSKYITFGKEGVIGDWIIISPKSTRIGPLKSEGVKVSITVPCNAGEFEGTVKELSGSKIKKSFEGKIYAGGRVVDVKIDVVFPINIEISGKNNIGRLISGKSNKETYIIGESYGYIDVDIIEINLEKIEFTPGFGEAGISNVKVIPRSLDKVGSSGKPITLYIDVPLTGTTPGNYTGSKITVTHGGKKYAEKYISFEIPRPEIEISKSDIYLPNIESGKKETNTFIIKEGEGYTTIENVSISIKNCVRMTSERTEYYPKAVFWITFEPSDIPYISPGDSNDINVEVIKDTAAPDGNYVCGGEITTKYAGSENITVSFSDCPTIRNRLNELKSIYSTGYGNSLLQETISLLEHACGEQKSKAEALEVSSNVETLVTSKALNNAKSYKIGDDYKDLINNLNTANEEVNELKNACNAVDKLYNDEIHNIKNYADKYLMETGRSIAEQFRAEGSKYETNCYKKSYENYHCCSEILLKTKNIDSCNSKSIELKNKYNNAVSEAEKFKKRGNEMYALSNAGNFHGVIIFPWDYNKILNYYDEATTNRDNAQVKYTLAGETGNATLIKEDISGIIGEKNEVKLLSRIYYGVLLILIVGGLIKSVIGYMDYRKDISEMKIRKVVMKH